MQKGDNNLINSTNKINVLNVLWKEASASKTDIAKTTSLSVPTVMKIMNELSDKGLINEIGKGVSSGGKRPTMLEFNKSAYYIIGIDINEYWTEVVLVNLQLGIEEKRIQDIRTTDNEHSVIQRVIKEIYTIFEQHTEKRNRIIGVGIAIPGLIDSKRGIVVHSSEMNWHGVNVKDAFKEFFDGEIAVEETTRAMASAEKRMGTARDIDNFVYVNIGYSIGSAIVTNGKLYYGSNRSSGRLGHMVVEKNGVPCTCGNYGCLEQYASGHAIERIARERLLENLNSQIYDLVFGHIEKVDAYIVFEAAKNGDDLAVKILNEAADYLGIVISSVVNLIDPQLIIFDGKVCRASEVYMKMFQEILVRRHVKLAKDRIHIADSKKDNNLASIGAATFVLERFIERGGEVKKLLKCL